MNRTHRNTLTYKGYTATIGFDAIDRIFFGRLAGIQDIVTFHGKTVDELEEAFKEAVDDYLATCASLGDDPNKPYSGKVTLRIPPRIHAAIATAAETSGKSLNKWVADILDQAARNP
jgi:predicted HicB family RNase H-like nuclease